FPTRATSTGHCSTISSGSRATPNALAWSTSTTRPSNASSSVPGGRSPASCGRPSASTRPLGRAEAPTLGLRREIPHPSLSGLGLGDLDQLDEGLGLKGRAPDQAAVNVSLIEQVAGVGRLHRATVENADLAGDRRAEALGQHRAN